MKKLTLSISLILIINMLFAQWVQLPFVTSSDHLFSICFIDEYNGWVSGYDANLGTGIILKTTNGGNTWQRVNITDTKELEDVFFIDQNTGWAAGKNGKIIKTIDGGSSWIHQSSGTTSYISSIFFTDDDNGWIVYDGGVYPDYYGIVRHTINGGQNWSVQDSVLNYSHNAVFFTTESVGFIAGDNRGNNSEIFKTTNSGFEWQKTSTNTGHTIFNSIFFSDDTNGWIVGSNGTIIKTTDGGISWQDQSTDIMDAIYSIYFESPDVGIAVGRFGRIVKTTDGGNNWEESESGTSKGLTSVYFSNELTGWIVGYSGTFLRTNLGITNIQNGELLDSQSEIIFYPNPATDHIKISAKNNISIQKLTIYDLKGKILIDINQSKDIIDISKISPGLYIIESTTVKSISQTKMIITR